jgi:hypothetical protein
VQRQANRVRPRQNFHARQIGVSALEIDGNKYDSNQMNYSMNNLSWRLWVNWDWFCDWLGYAPDRKIYATPDDIQ